MTAATTATFCLRVRESLRWRSSCNVVRANHEGNRETATTIVSKQPPAFFLPFFEAALLPIKKTPASVPDKPILESFAGGRTAVEPPQPAARRFELPRWHADMPSLGTTMQ